MDCLEQCHPVVIVTPLHTGDDLKHCGTTRGKEGGTVAQLGGGTMWYNWGGGHCGTTGGEGALWQSSDLVTRYDWIQDPETVLTPRE